jgi:hypothetical protein
MREHFNDQMKLKCSELQVETSTSIAKMQAEHSAALKALEEQSILVLSQHIAFMATLPKESKAGRERREAEKKKAHQEKMSRQVRKGGGFKKRVLKETEPEVIKARRASRRKLSKDTKKEAEAQRALTFGSEKVVESVVEVAVAEVEVIQDDAKKVDNTESVVEDEVVEDDAKKVDNTESVVEDDAKKVDNTESVVEDDDEIKLVEVFKCVDLVVETRPKHISKCVDEDDWKQVKSRKKQPTVQTKQPNRTQMCESVESNKSCRHGTNCRFAHDVSELVFPECSFGNNCNNVNSKGNGMYSSVYGKICIRSHPGETKESVCARVGITIPKVIVPFSSVYMPTLKETGVCVKSSSLHLPPTSSAWQKQIKIEPDATTLVVPSEVKVRVSEMSREQAFTALANPKSNPRTRMCESVDAKTTCRHGSSCRFAHSFSELVFATCLFGESCKHVEYTGDGVYKNVWGKSCNRLHPYETKASICSRSDIKVVSAPLVKPAPLVTPSPPVTSTPEETVIRVPKEFVIQAMELAMKSGKTNIRVEIV